jgi:hypothetical protein
VANGIDPSLIQRGTRGTELLTAPTLFQQTLPGLFAGSSQLQFDETQGGRFKKFFLGGLFGPTKKEREANKREVVAEKAALNRRTTGIIGQFKQAGIDRSAASFPAVRDAIQAAAAGEAQGLSDVQSILAQAPRAVAGREAATERARISDRSAELGLEQAELTAAGGRFGSGIDANRFFAIRDKVGTQVAGASSLFNIADTVESLTDVEMAAIGAGAGGEIQGQIEAELFSLMRSMQTLLESGEGSVLRKSDQELIEGALGDPSSFVSNVFSRESKTLGSLRRFGEILLESAGRELVGLDQTTIGLLAPVMQMSPSRFARPDGPDVDPAAAESDFTAPAAAGPAAGAGPTGGVERLLRKGFDAFVEFEESRREANK